jgi:hypothetical protein
VIKDLRVHKVTHQKDQKVLRVVHLKDLKDRKVIHQLDHRVVQEHKDREVIQEE